MANFFERLAQGPGALQQNDYDDWNREVGSVDPDRFHDVASQVIQQVPPDEYYQHVQPGVAGTDPLGRLPQNQLVNIAQSLIGALTGSGLRTNEIQQNANIRSLDPRQMSPEELANLLQWTKQNDPDALSHVATQYRDQPDILHSLLSNKALIGLALGLGAKLLTSQLNQRQMPNLGSPRPMM